MQDEVKKQVPIKDLVENKKSTKVVVHSLEPTDFSKVYETDHSKSPMYQFVETLKSGKRIDTINGKVTECVLKGVQFNLIDGKTNVRFSESLSIEDARKVFIEGKDTEVFSPKFQEAFQKHLANIEESDIEEFGNDPQNYGLNTQFTPLGNGPLNQQLYLHDTWDQLAKAFQAYNHNPYAKRAIDIICDFVLGRGFSINFADPDLQDAWDANEVKLAFRERIYTWTRDFLRQGEIFLRYMDNPITGDLDDIIDVEASTIWEVITDPQNINKVYGYWQQYQTQYQLFSEELGVPGFEYVVNMFTPDEMLHYKLNVGGAEKRGRSCLYTALSYLKMTDDYLAAIANKAIASACLILDWTIDGNEGDVRSATANQSQVAFRKPISSIYHSKNVEVKSISTNIDRGKDQALEYLITAIAVSVGVGKEYLGASGSVTRASAVTGTEPAIKNFEFIQNILTFVFHRIITHWIEKKIEAGTINLTKELTLKGKISKVTHHLRKSQLKDAFMALSSAISGTKMEVAIDKSVDIRFPEVIKGSISEKLQNIGFMYANNFWSHRRASETASAEWPDIANFNYDEEMTEIHAQGSQAIVATLAQMPTIDLNEPIIHPSQMPVVDGSNPTSTVNNQKNKQRPTNANPTSSSRDANHENIRNHPGGGVLSRDLNKQNTKARASGITASFWESLKRRK